jgi:hypothetical protein
MMAQVTTSKLISNNETFTTGSYNGFEILIRDYDGYTNATILVHQINQKENKRKQLKSFFKGTDFNELKDEILKNLQDNMVGKILPTLQYVLRHGYTNEFMGTYVHSKLVSAIALWASAKYYLIVSEIMDNINLQAHLLEVDGNDHL